MLFRSAIVSAEAAPEIAAQTAGALPADGSGCSEGFPRSLTAALGGEAADIAGLPASYKQAARALEQKFFHGAGKVYSCAETAAAPQGGRYPTSLEERLMEALKQHDMGRALETVDQFIEEMREAASAAAIRFFAGELVVQAAMELRKVKSLPIESDWLHDWRKRLESSETVKVLRDRMREWLSGVVERIRRDEQAATPMAKALEYMKTHLHRNISLHEVAEHVGMSPAYFSTMFKQEHGKNYIDVLVELRMKKSLKLLEETGMTVAQIGRLAGYESYRYFTKVFKDHFGVSPTEYRAQLNGGRRITSAW